MRPSSFKTVEAIGRTLPDVEVTTTFGKPALKVRGKMFACIPSHRSAEPDSLVIRIDFDRREELIAADPNTYYLKDHYVGYPCVLVRLTRVRHDELRDLLLMAWRFVSTSDKPRVAHRKRK